MEINDFSSTIEWYNNHSAEYADEIKDAETDSQIVEFAGLLNTDAQVLDVGSAAGRDTHKFTENGLKPVGIDISQGLINQARLRFPNENFIQCDFLNMPFADNTFDGAWSHMSLVHLETFEEVEKAIIEITRVLKKGGLLHIQVKAQLGAEKTAIKSDLKSGQNRFFRYFTLGEIKSLLEKNFEIINLEQYHETDIPGTLNRLDVDLIIGLARKR